ncbi:MULTISPECIES: DUF5819 family protein [Streptomyces]|uniref:DUF5819 family protein n=1 Tax=Streptomyces lonegramiae TaxID=3075524 RepID=A0ABU2XHN8_9ACTN|nr:DUF5819 family protein [Streptomyces sp. DSM 41529]MDT0545451.1 DUF5819 family protein [Streptomyces sp. DSM 41529]
MAETGRYGEKGAGETGAGGPLSLPSQLVVAVGLAVVVAAVAVHLGMAFLNVSPPNTVSKQHSEAIDDYIYPEFERNWKLFAPNPLQQNIAVQARAEIRTPEGGTATTGWRDLSAQDGAAIRHNPLPSHTQQNQLRRAWEFYALSHNAEEQPNGLRGQLSGQYLRRLVMLRLGMKQDGGTVQRVQLRSVTRQLAAPPWSEEKIDTRPGYRLLPWWTVTADDLPEAKRR